MRNLTVRTSYPSNQLPKYVWLLGQRARKGSSPVSILWTTPIRPDGYRKGNTLTTGFVFVDDPALQANLINNWPNGAVLVWVLKLRGILKPSPSK